MPCNAVATMNVVLGNLADLALSQSLEDSQMMTTLLSLMQSTLEENGATNVSAYQPNLALTATVGYDRISVTIQRPGRSGGSPQVYVTSGSGDYEMVARMQKAIGDLLETVGIEVLAGMTGEALEADGFDVAYEEDEEGNTVVRFAGMVA